MILIIVGTSKQDFNRLLKEIDHIAGNSDKDFLMQIGNSDYEPKNANFFKFMPKNKIEKLYKEAEFVISHAGAGSIITANKYGKRIIIVPRRKKYGELFDDHQAEISEKLEKTGIEVIWDIKKIENTLKFVDKDYLNLESTKNQLIPKLKKYLNDLNSNKNA